ncbi:hypothetical protein [Sediminibacillus albus]|uniref:Lipoprotein n=1 Tax=Sediminibacillus albus TaxID=407036 RepID=A0A1G8WF17_9BACI|nr:hypothetical protein [Sediminibacillus albus]SDJ76120.1 hypothetical protein SAMN05216243_0712 [Sediminibacillus albus]
MKKMIILSVFILLFLISGCSDKEAQSIIVKSEEQPAHSEKKPAFVEMEQEGEKSEQEENLLEFTLPNEQIVINLNEVDILKNYLSIIPDRQREIESMSLTRVDIPDKDTIYLLQFSCREDACSYLLLNQQEQGGSFLAADLAKFKSASVSPDNKQLMLLFSRIESMDGVELTRDKLVMIQLEGMKQLYVAQEKNTPFENNYQWPILSAKWEDSDHLSITIPEIPNQGEKTLKDWHLSDKQTKKIQLTVFEK